MERAGRAVAWAVRRALARQLRAAGRRRVRQGQQRRRRARRGARARGAGACASTCSSSPTASTDAAFDARARARRPRGRRDVRHRVPRRARRRRRMGRRAARATAAAPVVAVDIPSGVDGLTGAVRGAGGARRRDGHASRRSSRARCSSPAARTPGDVEVADIGIDRRRSTARRPPARSTATDVAAWLPPRAPDAHKWRVGVLVVGGSGGMTGAPMLVSHAAMRAGAGIVWCALPGARRRARRRAARSSRTALPADADGVARRRRGRRRARRRSTGSARSRSGPGSAASASAPQLVVRALVAEARVAARARRRRAQRARRRPRAAARARRRSARPTVLTPHDGRVRSGSRARRSATDRVAAARALAGAPRRGRAAEGPGHGRRRARRAAVAINPTGGAALATAGTGDVLTGIIAGFLARGVDAVRGRRRRRLGARSRPPTGWSTADGPGLVAGDSSAVWPVRCRRWERTRDASAAGPSVTDAAGRCGARSTSTPSAPTSRALRARRRARGAARGGEGRRLRPRRGAGGARRARRRRGWLGVALVEEGEQLREAGIDAPILRAVGTGARRGRAASSRTGSRRSCTPTAGIDALAKAVADAGRARPARRAPQGRHRHAPRRLHARRRRRARARVIAAHDELALAGVCTHLAVADEPDNPYTDRAARARSTPCSPSSTPPACAPPLVHAANSAGALACAGARYDLVRVGIALLRHRRRAGARRRASRCGPRCRSSRASRT